MSVISKLPTWARTEAENFRSTGHLSGDKGVKQPIPAGMQDEVQSQLTGQLDQLIQTDESPLDEAKGQLGTVKVDQFGMKATAHFEGTTQNGSIVLEAEVGPMNTAAYCEGNENSTQIVQVLDMGDNNYGTVGAFFDKQNPANSYIEMKNVPTEFNIFGG